MRPERANIAIPHFPPGLAWVGDEPPAVERITAGGPVLVHFFEIGELRGVRTLPYLNAWAERYDEHGLTILGIHTPRSDLARELPALKPAIERLEIGFPVANDREYRLWHAYGCKGWPSLFLWAQGGALSWFHFGEGAYLATELAIQEEIAESISGLEGLALPEPIGSLRPEDADDARLITPSAEVFPGGSHDRAWTPAEPGEPLEVEYAAGGAWASLGGEGAIEVSVDGGELRRIAVEAPGLYELSKHDVHGIHEVRIELEDEIRIWSVGFAAGLEP